MPAQTSRHGFPGQDNNAMTRMFFKPQAPTLAACPG